MEQKKRKSDFRLPSVDDLFTTQEMRDVESMTSGHILDIPISEIDDFPEHPFIVRDDEEMEALMASIKVHGVIEPVTVRKKDDGRYEMISGHRRKHASSRLGLDTIRCEVVELTREEAILQMVESNLHREHILPSEKAFAYKMRLEAMKRQGQRTDLTSSPLATKLSQGRSDVELAEQVGESKDQIRRYIHLTNLIPEILEFVDNSVLKIRGKLQIALRPAVELSYLSEEEQTFLLELMNCHDCTPSHAQAIRMRRMSEEGSLDYYSMQSIIAEVKSNQKSSIKFPKEIAQLLPAGISEERAIKLICDALSVYKPKNNTLDNKPIKGQKEITDYDK